MIKVSTKGRYGVRLMVDLAAHFDQGPIALKDIARRQEISAKYLWQLIPLLKSAGLVNSIRGSHGGYMLTRAPAEINLHEIMTVLEGNVCLVDCVANSKLCKRSALCVTRDIWSETSEKIKEVFRNFTLEKMLSRQSKLSGKTKK
jgi:Rrf2 family protein